MAKTAVLKPFLAIATDKMKAKTVAELQARTEFKEGDVVEVLGELVAGDGKHHMRIASKVADASGVQGQGGLFWNVVPNSLISLIAQAIEQNKSDILSIHTNAQVTDNPFNVYHRPYGRPTSANEIDKSGIYMIEDIDGSPNGGQGTLIHAQWNKTKELGFQLFGSVFDNELFFRQRGIQSDYTKWNEWGKVLTTVNCPISKNSNGWCRFANGLIIQWGSLTMCPSSNKTVYFPISFSTDYQITNSRNFAYHTPDNLNTALINKTNSACFTIYTGYSTDYQDSVDDHTWIAIGW